MDLGGNVNGASTFTGSDAGASDAGGCTQDQDCDGGFFCAAQECIPQGAGGTTCTADDQCSSGICGIGGTGNCCTAACNAGADAGCSATGCDDTGACVYPSSTGCPCGPDAGCAAGNYCSAGGCVTQASAGAACTGNNQCASGVCGVAGTGNCCSGICPAGSDAGCYATDCDNTGACVYPSSSGCPCAKDADCKDARICDKGACVFPGAGACFIQGQFIAGGDYNSANSCQICDPKVNDDDWTTNFTVAATARATTSAGQIWGPWPFSSTVGGRQDTILVGGTLPDGSYQIALRDAELALRSTFTVGSELDWVATADLNADGFNDVVVAGYTYATNANTISLFLNDSDGGFTVGPSYSAPGYSYDGGSSTYVYLNDLAVGDFNGDGTQEVSLCVTLDLSEGTYPRYLTELHLSSLDDAGALSDGGIATPSFWNDEPGAVQQVGDFNEDGKTDILLWIPSSPSRGTDGGSGLMLLLSDGGGQFSQVIEPMPGLPSYAEPKVVGDFDGDGHLDVVFLNSDETLSVELGDGQGSFGQAKTSGIPSSPAYNSMDVFLVASDFNGDGQLDLGRFDVNACQSGLCDQRFTIWLGLGDGTFLEPGPAIVTSSLPSGWIAAWGYHDRKPLTTLDVGNGRADLVLNYWDNADPYLSTSVFQNGCK